MINVLLSLNDFSDGALKDSLAPYLKPAMTVLVIPFSHGPRKMPTVVEYDEYCSKGGRYHKELIENFGSFGIKQENIDLIHYYQDSHQTMVKKIAGADVLFFTGGLPDKTVERVQKKGLMDAITSFKGIVMGVSAGALIQLPDYFCTPDKDYPTFAFYRGLGLIKHEFLIDVHYEGTPLLDTYPELRGLDRPIYALPNGSGIICNNDEVRLVGDITVFN
jgi:peptidase E